MSHNAIVGQTTCPPITNKAFEHNGAFVTSAAFLSAHYSMNADCNGQGVVIPWVWNARFAAELAIQGCVSALDDSFQKCSSHKFADLLSCWCEATQKHIGNDSAEINRFKQKFRCIKYHEQIDQYDPDGLWLRYPTPDLQSNITQQQHCEWPLLCRKLIAEVCSITKYFLEKSDVGTDELDYLVYAAANGSCPGHFGVEIDPTVSLCPDDFAELSEFSRSCISVPFPSFSVEISSD